MSERPGYHVTPEAGWINDPNGPIEWDGRFHLFFQRNPLAPEWAPRIHWGHAVSDDLCAWTMEPDAFGPSADGPDAGGCWSGCVVDDAGTPTAVYSGLDGSGAAAAENVCLARGDRELRRWRKDPANPVIAGPPAGARLAAFRDPFVWREDGRWRMLIGAGLPDGHGAVLAYRSADLLAWHADGALLRGTDDGFAAGQVWECPQYFALGDRRVLLLSIWDDGGPSHVMALVGSEAEGRFTIERAVRFDHGADCYAPATMADSRGRRLAWAWSWEHREAPSGPSAGALTLPRVLSLGSGGALTISPAPELRGLRRAHEQLEPATLGDPVLARTRGDRVEVDATIDPGSAATVSLRMRMAPGGEEQTVISFRRADGSLRVTGPDAAAHGSRLELAPGEPLRLHVFVDRSLLEVFANDRMTITERIRCVHPDSTGIAFDAAGGQARMLDACVWTLSGR